MWRDGADSRYIGGTTAGVAELADAQDLGFDALRLLTLTHRYSTKHKAYQARVMRKTQTCSTLLILSHREAIDKLETRRTRAALSWDELFQERNDSLNPANQ